MMKIAKSKSVFTTDTSKMTTTEKDAYIKAYNNE